MNPTLFSFFPNPSGWLVFSVMSSFFLMTLISGLVSETRKNQQPEKIITGRKNMSTAEMHSFHKIDHTWKETNFVLQKMFDAK